MAMKQGLTAEVTQAEKLAFVLAHFKECPEELRYSIISDAREGLNRRRFSWQWERIFMQRRQELQ
jgi:hypothetical protein